MSPKLKIHLAQINTSVGDLSGNTKKIIREAEAANQAGCDLVVFCEMTLTGYPCEDLWQKKHFLAAVEEKISEICAATKSMKCAILLGAPVLDVERKKEVIRNAALLIEDGEVKRIIAKKTLPNFEVFDEARYFAPAAALSYIEFRGLTLAVLICEDLWNEKNHFLLSEQIFDAAIVINSSPFDINKQQDRFELASNLSKNLGKPLIYVNQVGAQDSLVFDGASFVIDSAGNVALQMKEFVEDFAQIQIEKSGEIITPTNANQKLTTNQKLYQACVLGLRDYIEKNGFKKVLLGMSGGIDSALVAAIAVEALGAKNVSLYALPTRFNAESSMVDAKNCAKNLGCELEIISIEPALESMNHMLRQAQHDTSGLVGENLQARIRGNILMAISNETGALLLSTGNKSELACGYATLYGDMCGAFNPIKDLYKTQVFELARLRADVIPHEIITKAPSAELRPNQKDSDSLPDYEILDKILFALIEEEKSVEKIIAAGFEADLVKKVAKLFYASEYKRLQACPGPKVSRMAFGKERRYPITNKFIA